jgi:acyl-CoA reductase-like NAD-dependent aldehyde dehydrogenase
MMYPKLVPHWIADVEVTPKDTATFEKRNPANDKVIAEVARGGAAEVAQRLSSAAAAAEDGARTPVPKRGAILGRAAQLLREREEGVRRDRQAETGKPWKNAVAEVGSSADLAIFMEGEGSRCTARRCRARFRIARCRRCDRRSASARRSCRSTARWPASPGKCFPRCCAATPWS